jgi:hypothetical protein
MCESEMRWKIGRTSSGRDGTSGCGFTRNSRISRNRGTMHEKQALPAAAGSQRIRGPDGVSSNAIPVNREGMTLGGILHGARVAGFYGLSGLFTAFLTFELFAHLLVATPVVTDWAHGHHIHALAHFVLTAVLIPAAGMGLHPRTRRIAGLQVLMLVPVLGLAVSLIAWRFHGLDFPVFNFTLYGVVSLLLAVLHPQRGRLFTRGASEPRLLAMAGLAFVILLVYASEEVAKQLSNAEPVHAVVGHFALMGALYVALPALAGLAALRTQGWRLPLWSSGVAVAALGLGSIIFPQEASSLGRVGGLAAMVWGLTFIWLGNRTAPRRVNQPGR